MKANEKKKHGRRLDQNKIVDAIVSMFVNKKKREMGMLELNLTYRDVAKDFDTTYESIHNIYKKNKKEIRQKVSKRLKQIIN